MARSWRARAAALGKSPQGDLFILGLIAVAKLLFHLATSGGYGIFRDELYYIACSEHLDFGYVDHPPLSILLLWLARRSFGDSLLAIRCLVAAAGALSVFVAGLIARELGGRRGAQVLAALAVFFAPVLLAFSHFFSMNAFDLLFWTLLELLAVRILRRDAAHLWIAFGLLAGLGLENKYSVGFFVFGLAVGLLLTPQRRHLTSKWLWGGAALAALVFLPHLWWEVANGLPSLAFMRHATAEKNVSIPAHAFFLQQILLLNPIAFPLWLIGLLALLVAPAMRSVRALGWAYVAVFVLFVTQGAKVYYLAPIYPLLFAAGAVGIERVGERRSWRWVVPAYAAAVVVVGGALVPMSVPVLPEEEFIAYQQAIGLGQPQMERGRQGALPQVFADMHGWTELVDAVAHVFGNLPPDRQARTVILTTNYGEAGAIDFLGRSHGLPHAISGHNNYWLWGPGRLRRDDTVIAVGFSREQLLAAFDEVDRADTVRCRYCMPYENELPIHVARGLKAPLPELWERLKRFV